MNIKRIFALVISLILVSTCAFASAQDMMTSITGLTADDLAAQRAQDISYSSIARRANVYDAYVEAVKAAYKQHLSDLQVSGVIDNLDMDAMMSPIDQLFSQGERVVGMRGDNQNRAQIAPNQQGAVAIEPSVLPEGFTPPEGAPDGIFSIDLDNLPEGFTPPDWASGQSGAVRITTRGGDRLAPISQLADMTGFDEGMLLAEVYTQAYIGELLSQPADINVFCNYLLKSYTTQRDMMLQSGRIDRATYDTDIASITLKFSAVTADTTAFDVINIALTGF